MKKRNLKITGLLLTVVMLVAMLGVFSLAAFATGETTNPWESTVDDDWYYDAGEYEACAVETCSGVYVSGVCNVCGDSQRSTQVQNAWQQQTDNWYYYNDEGESGTGWQLIDGEWYYFDPETGVLNEEITSSADTGTLYIEMTKMNNTLKCTIGDIATGDERFVTLSVGDFADELMDAVVKFLNETKNWGNYFSGERMQLAFTDFPQFEGDVVFTSAIYLPYQAEYNRSAFIQLLINAENGEGFESSVIYHKLYDASKTTLEGGEGTITPIPSSKSFVPGETVKLEIKPEIGYRVDEVIVVAEGDPSVRFEVTKVDEQFYTFIMPHTDVRFEYTTFVPCDHSDNTNTSTDNTDGTHSFTCSLCRTTVTEDHSGGTATCSAKAVCEKCGEPYGELDSTNHDTSAEYDNGFCKNCDAYEPATQVDESNRADFGFTDGTYDGYWAIGNLGQLMWFAENVASAKHSAILTADITIDNSVVWTPITLDGGDAISSIFDGGGHTVTFDNTNENSTFGLFDQYHYSIIENLYLAGSIKCNTAYDVGVLVNSAYRTTIRNVISTCDITNTASSGGVGGLAGQFGGTDAALIENCAVYADIMGGDSAGGLIGNIWGGTQYCTVRNCAYVGNVADGTNSGAIVGHNGSSTTSTFSNIYFCETDGIGWIGSVGSGKTSLTDVEAKTAEQFASGEVAYLLQGNQETHVWGQTIYTDKTPVLGGAKVYKNQYCNDTILGYSNTASDVGAHLTNEHGYCELCEVKITGASITAGVDLTMKYYVKLIDTTLVGAGDKLAMQFTMNGKTVTVTEYTTVNGEYVFAFDGIAPQCMADLIDAVLVIVNENGEIVKTLASKEGYSVKANAEALLEKYSTDTALVQFVTDMLYYGAAAQNYRDHSLDQLANAGITGTPSTALPETSDKSLTASTSESVYFTSVTVWFDNVNKIGVYFSTVENVTLKVNGEAVELTGTTYYTDAIYATDFNKVYTFELYDGDTLVQKLTYSVASYVYAMMNQVDAENNPTEMAELAMALYRYGASAVEYKNAQNSES